MMANTKRKTRQAAANGIMTMVRTSGGGAISVRLYALDQVEAQAIADAALVKPSRRARRQKRGWKRGRDEKV